MELQKWMKKVGVSSEEKTSIHCKGRSFTSFTYNNNIYSYISCEHYHNNGKEANREKIEKIVMNNSGSDKHSETDTSFPASSSTSTCQSSGVEIIPHDLKQLQLHMVKPGKRITVSSDSTNSCSHSTIVTKTMAETTTIDIATVSLPGSSKASTKNSGNTAKRSLILNPPFPHTKKAKIIRETLIHCKSNSVKVNFMPDENEISRQQSDSCPSLANMITHSSDIIANSLYQRKKPYYAFKVKLPPGKQRSILRCLFNPLFSLSGHPADVHQWTVTHVVDYFKSTGDCTDYVDLFETNDLDGTALLLLTNEILVKHFCMKLGPALKIMNRITALSCHHYHMLKE